MTTSIIKITKEQYQQGIPKCCGLETVEQHEMELMLCWGLLNALRKGTIMDCGTCEFNKENYSS